MSDLEKLKDVLQLQPFSFLGVQVSIGDMLAGLVAFFITWLISSATRRGIGRYGTHHPDANQATLYTFARLLHYLILAAGVLIALQVAGVPLSQFAVFTGAIGVGLGFGMQAIFSNFVSGLILLFDRSLKVGDFIELDSDTRGVVKSIDIRSTLITTNDNIDILVPNSEFVTKRLVNWTHGSLNRRIRIAFSVDIDVEKELVKKAALDAAGRVPFTLATSGPKRPQLWLTGGEGSALKYILAVWLTEAASRRNAAVRAAYLWELDSALKRHGIQDRVPRQEMSLSRHSADRFRRGAEAPETRDTLSQQEREALSANDAKEEAQRDTSAAPPATR